MDSRRKTVQKGRNARKQGRGRRSVQRRTRLSPSPADDAAVGPFSTVFQPLTAPATNPFTMYFWKKKNTKTVDVADKLFDEIAPKYADRKGGYTRIVKIGQRKGDAAMEVFIELV